jgi:phosphorylase superfamily protein
LATTSVKVARSGKATVKATEKKSTGRSRTTEQRVRPGAEPVAIPLLEFDASRVVIIEPARIIKPIDISEHCVWCFFQEVIRELVSEGANARQVHTGQSEAGDYPVYELDYGGRRLAVVSPGVGAPAAAARLEHMIALGCRKFIACGGAGTLDSAIAVGQIVVPDSAIRDEGTLYHYLKPARDVARPRRGRWPRSRRSCGRTITNTSAARPGLLMRFIAKRGRG